MTVGWRKYDDGVYSRMEFLRAVSHSVAHTDVLRLHDMAASDTDDDTAQDEAPTSSPPEYENAATETCEVSLLQPRSAVALIPRLALLRRMRGCGCGVGQRVSTVPLPHPNGPASIQLVHCLCDLGFLLEPYYDIAYLRTFGWVARPRLFRL